MSSAAPDASPEAAAVPSDASAVSDSVDRAESAGCITGSVRDERVRRVIREVWGKYARAAIRVARCESAHLGTRAVKGQFRGLFQMGRWARRKFGHSRCAEEQARAAYRYFRAAGRSFKPWAGCNPRRRSRRRR
jgi:hypothetical protein